MKSIQVLESLHEYIYPGSVKLHFWGIASRNLIMSTCSNEAPESQSIVQVTIFVSDTLQYLYSRYSVILIDTADENAKPNLSCFCFIHFLLMPFQKAWIHFPLSMELIYWTLPPHMLKLMGESTLYVYRIFFSKCSPTLFFVKLCGIAVTRIFVRISKEKWIHDFPKGISTKWT